MLTQHSRSGAIYDWSKPHLQSHAHYVIGPLPPPPEQLIQASDARRRCHPVDSLNVFSFFLFVVVLVTGFLTLSSFFSCLRDVFRGDVLIAVRLIRLPF